MDACASAAVPERPTQPFGPATTHDLLRFLTCGSVDDGKSTLVGRLLFESQTIMEDTMASLSVDSRRHGTTGDEIDLALLVDGLEAERQQGITIDVAYRYFATPRRSFIIADTPGHEQYTRNMATGASTCDLAVILIDARKGVLVQTRRHAYICSLLGIRAVVVAVNKIDLVGYDQDTFDAAVAEFVAFAEPLGFHTVQAVPLSARFGDNVVERSANTPWYKGPTLLSQLETVEVKLKASELPFRFPVQWVNRPDGAFRGFSGTVASGVVKAEDDIVVAASGKSGRVVRIVTADGDLDRAVEGDAVTLVLDREIDIARGDILAMAQHRPVVTDQVAAHILWMDDSALLPGRQYLVRIGNLWTSASITSIRHRVNVDTLDHAPSRELAINEVGACNVAFAQRVPVDPYADNRTTGAFLLVDRFTHRTAGVGLVDFSLRRADNIFHEDFVVDKAARAALNGQTPMVIWFTGLSGSGKSTIANLVEQHLHLQGRRTFSLDGDNIRHGLNRDLGFTDADRVENIRRIGEVARLLVDAGLIVLCSFISPFVAERRMVRAMFAPEEFVEVFVDTPIEECQRRDPKGLYAKAMRGDIKNFTGIDSGYEIPEALEMRLTTVGRRPQEAAAEVLDWVARRAERKAALIDGQQAGAAVPT